MSTRLEKSLKIDQALARYYEICGRGDYLDEHGMGKFIKFILKQEFIDEMFSYHYCHLWLSEQTNFPLPSNIFISQENKGIYEFYIVQYCCTYLQSPTYQEIEQIALNLAYNEAIWWMMGVSIGWIFINVAYFDFFEDDEDDDDLYTIIELEEGEPLSVPSDWEY